MRYSFKVYLILCFFPFIATSCFQRCNGEEFKFRVRIEILMSQKESLELVYTNKKKEKQKVQGVANKKFIEFCLNEEPLELQFVFNESRANKEIKIKSLLLENNDNQMFIEEDMFYLYFVNNKYIKYNKKQNSYRISHDKTTLIKPTLSSRNSLKKRLKKRLKI